MRDCNVCEYCFAPIKTLDTSDDEYTTIQEMKRLNTEQAGQLSDMEKDIETAGSVALNNINTIKGLRKEIERLKGQQIVHLGLIKSNEKLSIEQLQEIERLKGELKMQKNWTESP